jgi:transcriptional antiterminator
MKVYIVAAEMCQALLLHLQLQHLFQLQTLLKVCMQFLQSHFSSSANFALLSGLVQVQLMLFQSELEYSNRTLRVLRFVIVQDI